MIVARRGGRRRRRRLAQTAPLHRLDREHSRCFSRGRKERELPWNLSKSREFWTKIT
jgi:hypothetical protein